MAVRSPHSDQKTSLIKGLWSPEEDEKLIAYINRYGIWNWTEMPKPAGLRRSGKSCRLRWVNYLRPGIKRGNFSQEEENTIINLHQRLGNRWSAMAAELPGRTDNEIKNFWNTRLKKRKIKNLSRPTEELHAAKTPSNEANDTNLAEGIDLILLNTPNGSNTNKIPMSPEVLAINDVCSPGTFNELLQRFWPCPTEHLYDLQEPIYPSGLDDDFWGN